MLIKVQIMGNWSVNASFMGKNSVHLFYPQQMHITNSSISMVIYFTENLTLTMFYLIGQTDISSIPAAQLHD